MSHLAAFLAGAAFGFAAFVYVALHIDTGTRRVGVACGPACRAAVGSEK